MPGQSDKNFVDITVKSTSGTFADRYNRNNKAQKVFDDAVAYFGLNTSAGTYTLSREADGRGLSLSEKLEDLGVVDGDTLLLQTDQAQDG
ncbi:hypothetical protein QWY28_21865 [Nocardioides sp. SOB77]|uniref:Ubiquitin-like domain-containing protein n=1 Tax=Nocardioides oceani TaxID=3058369 RepID=A0ABT8FLS2_9ACTN|nr:EsaB/YukD family protein [Nocardioides oceani]MDN4175624.1 hypothetical protein [Nocardioides oceani]